MPQKIIWTFVGPTGDFWTEVYHGSFGSVYDATQIPTSIINERLAFLHASVTLDNITARDTAGNRKSYHRGVSLQGLVSGSGAVNAPAEASNCVIIRMYAVDYSSTLKYFRGFAANQFNFNQAGQASPPSSGTLIQKFCQDIAVAGYGWLPVTPTTKTVNGQYTYNQINKVDGTTTPGQAVLYLANTPTFTGTPMVYITGCDKKLLPGLNGIWSVANTSLNLVTVNYQVANNATITNPRGKLKVYLLQDLRAFNGSIPAGFEGFGNRKTRSDFTRGQGARRAPGIRALA